MGTRRNQEHADGPPLPPLSVITQWNGRLVKCAGMATDLMLDRGDPAFQLSDTSRTVPMRPDSSSINGESSRAISPSSCGHQAPFMRPVLRGPRVKRIDGRERSTGVIQTPLILDGTQTTESV